MHLSAAAKLVESVRRREQQGDHPTEPALSIETLEDLVLTLDAMHKHVYDSTGRCEYCGALCGARPPDEKCAHCAYWKRHHLGVSMKCPVSEPPFTTFEAFAMTGELKAFIDDFDAPRAPKSPVTGTHEDSTLNVSHAKARRMRPDGAA